MFNFRLNGNYLNRLDFVPTPGADREDQLESSPLLPGGVNAPKYSGTFDLTWTKSAVTLNYGLNYFSKTRRYTVDQVTANPDIADPKYIFLREKWEHDLQASFRVNDDFSFYGGVNNLTNKTGDVGAVRSPYSAIGRYFYAGFRAGF